MKVTLHDASTCPTSAISEQKIIPSPLFADVEHALERAEKYYVIEYSNI
jgi:hypothetical protein